MAVTSNTDRSRILSRW